MAGSLYLGSQRVCPAIVAGGGSPEPEPTECVTIRLPDGKIYNEDIEIDLYANGSICFDFNKIEVFDNGKINGVFNYKSNPIILKGIENIKSITSGSITNSFLYGSLSQNYGTELHFNNLEALGRNAIIMAFKFNNTTSVFFPKLKNMGSFCLSYSLTDGCNVYFNAVTTSTFINGDELDGIGVSQNKTLHFPSNLSSVIPTLTGYPNFGGTNTTILYDLPATE